MNYDPVEVGKRIKEARKAAGLSQTEFGDLIDKSLRTIQKYESGEIEVGIPLLSRMATVLKVYPMDLLGEERPEIKIDAVSDVMYFLHELNKKKEIRFEIEIRKPSVSDDWGCAIWFKGNAIDKAKYNPEIMWFLELYNHQRKMFENYESTPDYFETWLESYATERINDKLTDREIPNLTKRERLQHYLNSCGIEQGDTEE